MFSTSSAPSSAASRAEFQRLVEAALSQDFSGWDFSYLNGRWRDDDPAWDYRQIVFERSRHVESLLDMGTGGGEMLATLAPLPRRTWATEGYPPNVPVAQRRLASLGAQVVPVSGEEDHLPFEAESFDLVINRHESFDAAELSRILKPGAGFITQQVGGRHGIGLNERLQETVAYEYAGWTPQRAVSQLQAAGLQVVNVREDFPALDFFDIGAVVYYLKVIAWQIADFSVERYHQKLLALHHHIQQSGALNVAGHYFFIEAKK